MQYPARENAFGFVTMSKIIRASAAIAPTPLASGSIQDLMNQSKPRVTRRKFYSALFQTGRTKYNNLPIR
jgi:hypothetical protein